MFYVIVGILSTLFAIFVGSVIIAIESIYIVRNSRKYKMDTLFWVIVVILFQFVGFRLYWRARKKLCRKRCLICGAGIPEGKENCILCGAELSTLMPPKNSVGRFLVGIGAFYQVFLIVMYILISISELFI